MPPVSSYLITYHTSYGTVPTDATNYSHTGGSALVEAQLPVLSNPGMTFLGWYTSSTLEESAKAYVGMSFSGSNLYAKWEYKKMYMSGEIAKSIVENTRVLMNNSDLHTLAEVIDTFKGISYAEGVEF